MKNFNSKDNILIVIGRNDLLKDRSLNAALRKSLRGLGYRVVFYGSSKGDTSSFLDPEGRLMAWPFWLRKMVKALMLIRHPERWSHYLFWRSEEDIGIDASCQKFKRFVQKFGPNKNIVVLSRSAGGRVASLVADELGLAKLVCLAYPFKHPERSLEIERYAHLAGLKTPFLIIQGTDDVYNDPELLANINLSPAISLRYVNTDHDFKSPLPPWSFIVDEIRVFISKPEGL